MRRGVAILCALTAIGGTRGLAAQDAPSIDVQLGGRIQYQFHTTSVDDVPETTFEFRRLRLSADIAIGESIRGLIEPDFSQSVLAMKSAWLEYWIDPAFVVRAGQFKKPFGLLQLTSSLDYPTIERGLRIRGLPASYEAADDAEGAPVLARLEGPLLGEEQFLLDAMGYHGYDVGVAVHGALGVLGYQAGVFNGPGANALDADESKALALRLTASPLERLVLGAAVSRTDLALESGDATGVAWEIDAAWGGVRTSGPRLLAELSFGDNVVAADDFIAGQAVAGWFTPLRLGRVEGVEPVLRGSWGDPRRDVEDDAGVLVTPGLNLYFHARNRLMVNYDLFLPEGNRFEDGGSLKVQAQLAF